MFDLEVLKRWEVIFTLVAMVFGAASWIVIRFDKRSQRRSDAAKSEILGETRSVDARVSSVESRIGHLEEQHSELSGAVTVLDRDIQTVARSEAVTDLKVEQARQGAVLTQLNGMVDTIYRAATRAAVGSEKRK